MKKSSLFLLIAACCVSYGQNVLQAAPKSVLISFHAIELPEGYPLKIASVSAKKVGDQQVLGLPNDDLLKQLSADAKKDGVKVLAAPKVRTLDGYMATIRQTIAGSAAGPVSALSLTALPHVNADGSVSVEVHTKISAGEEGKEGFRLLWNSDATLMMAGKAPNLIVFKYKDAAGGSHRLLLFVGAEVIQDR